ncbi:MAG: hypothetical protein QOJ00_1421 [Actinomycetota bacterium]|jgi:hypothetical protein
MSLAFDSACALGIHADTETATIVVQVEGPVDGAVLVRIEEAVRPLLAVHQARVELEIAGDRQILDVA